MNPPAAPPLFAPLFEGPTDVFDYCSVFSVLPLPAILIDSRGTIVDVNDAYLAAATKTEESASADALVGRPVWDVAPDDDDPILPKAMVEQALASEADDLENAIAPAFGNGIEGGHTRASRGACHPSA